MRNAECGMRNAECGMRNAECGMRNAECGVRSAEWRIGEVLEWQTEAGCGVLTPIRLTLQLRHPRLAALARCLARNA